MSDVVRTFDKLWVNLLFHQPVTFTYEQTTLNVSPPAKHVCILQITSSDVVMKI